MNDIPHETYAQVIEYIRKSDESKSNTMIDIYDYGEAGSFEIDLGSGPGD